MVTIGGQTSDCTDTFRPGPCLGSTHDFVESRCSARWQQFNHRSGVSVMPVTATGLLPSDVGGFSEMSLASRRPRSKDWKMPLIPDTGVEGDQCVRRTRQVGCRAMLSGVAVW